MTYKFDITATFKHLMLFPVLFLCLNTTIFAQSSKLPLLDINKIRFDFGKTQYMETKCDKIVFKNIGDTILSINHVDSVLIPFSSNIVYPDTLNKGDSLVYYVCYQPNKASDDSQRVFLRADTRLSHSIGLLFDISSSMNDRMPNENVRKLDAAIAAGKSFINSMLTTPKVWDEAGVFSFAYAFYLNQDFTTNKTLLTNSLPTTLRNSTAFYYGCTEVLNRLKLRKFLKVMIALTDGEDNQSQSVYNVNVNNVINLAKANNIQIYTVGIGSSTADNILSNIATSTGGQFFKATTSKELTDIYYKIFSLLSKNIELYFDILGYSGNPGLEMICDTSTSIHPGDTLSYKIYLHQVSVQGALNNKYKLSLSFNRNLLYPLPNDKNNVYNNDGLLEINGVNTVNLDSLPLTEVKFLTLLGDSDCTDLKLQSLEWESKHFAKISSNSYCTVCISSCARGLRKVQSFNAVTLSQNQPNPFSNSTEIKFEAPETGKYRLNIFDATGRKIMNLLDEELKPGIYSFKLEANFPSGTYFYVLNSPTEVKTRMMTIIK